MRKSPVSLVSVAPLPPLFSLGRLSTTFSICKIGQRTKDGQGCGGGGWRLLSGECKGGHFVKTVNFQDFENGILIVSPISHMDIRYCDMKVEYKNTG
jgi:hypothetical protein